MTNCLLITTYNRPEYLCRCLESISNLTQFPDRIIIIDDASTDNETLDLIGKFDVPCETWVINKKENKGIKDSLKRGYELAFQDCGIVINLDGDAIVKPSFITCLLELHKQHPSYIISGFNCDNPKNPIKKDYTDYIIRQHVNGINMLITKKLYETHVVHGLNSAGNWDFNSTPPQGVIITKPSVVQHIGINSSMGHNGADVACDFYNLELPDVTLFGIDAHDPVGINRAAEISCKDINFGAVQIITEKLFSGREAYSRFCIQDMAKYINTSHILIIHADGYVQNWKAWDNEWLKYDYIGATWWYKDGMNCGNGGFSLRSKKLLDILTSLELDVFHPEDHVICRQLRPWLEKEYNIKFAPEEVANKFSIEAYSVPAPDNVYAEQFGFHGYHVLDLPIPPIPKTIQFNSPHQSRRAVGRTR